MNKRTHLEKYAKPLSEKILDAFAKAKVFSTLDLRIWLPLIAIEGGHNVKITFWPPWVGLFVPMEVFFT
jgi:hypothetical protein